MIDLLIQLFVQGLVRSVVEFNITGIIFIFTIMIFLGAILIGIFCSLFNPINEKLFKLIINFIYYGCLLILVGLFWHYIFLLTKV